MIILVLNCGSSSLKYQLLDMKGDDVYDLLAKGLVERIGMDMGCLKHQAAGKEKLVREMPIIRGAFLSRGHRGCRTPCGPRRGGVLLQQAYR